MNTANLKRIETALDIAEKILEAHHGGAANSPALGRFITQMELIELKGLPLSIGANNAAALAEMLYSPRGWAVHGTADEVWKLAFMQLEALKRELGYLGLC